MNNLSITKFTKDDIKSVYTVFELSIADDFHKEGIEDCEDNSVGELGSLYILPDYQDKGVGTALINSMIKYIHGLGIKEFCLDSGYSGAQKRWTRKFGKPYKIAKDYWGEEADNMVWLCRVSDYLK